MIARTLATVTLVAWCASARGETPVVGGVVPRTVGRAGTITASDDGAGALLVNPAGLARRESWRMQLGLAFVDDELSWIDAASAPLATDQAGSRLVPQLGIEGAIGGYIVGASFATTARTERLFRSPTALEIPPEFYGRSFQYRYAGLGGAFRRDTLTVGIARRLGDTVAAGLSIGASRVTVDEQRRLWAGDAARDGLDLDAPDPAHDIEVTLDAAAGIVPSAVFGVLVAPADSRVELAASIAWSAPARASGSIAAVGTPPGTSVATSDGRAHIEIEQPITARTGARWLGERWIAEVGGDLFVFPARARDAMWSLEGVTVADTTTLGAIRSAPLASVPSRLSSRTHGALRAALDVELIAGFLWATGGYAFTTAGVASTRQSPTFGDLGGHTAALGLEATAGGFTVTLGWSRTWSRRVAEPVTRWRLDNPLGTGDGPIPTGTFDGASDVLGISIDAELTAPE